MTTDFTAAPQALGYLYQVIRYSLYVAVTNVDARHKSIAIEKSDDIEVMDSGSTIEAFQIKQVKTSPTNRSTDLWKTVRVWCENYKSSAISLPDTVLTLVTTAKAPDGSIASLLRPRNRDPEKALELLRNETLSPNRTLEKSFGAFGKLSPPEQKILVDSIQVLDCAPDISSIEAAIKAEFKGIHQENWDRAYELLESWWLHQVIDHMRKGSTEPIEIASVIGKIADINSTISPPKLEDPFLALQAPADYDYGNRTFVLQLKLIDLGRELVARAVHDFYRAGELRNWLIDELHLLELTTYDEKLKEEWETYFFGIMGEFEPKGCDDTELSKIGRKVYNEIQQKVDVSIHTDFTSRYITRGSYQILADNREKLDIGWHPHFRDRIPNGDID